jgi:hypothetical protein
LLASTCQRVFSAADTQSTLATMLTGGNIHSNMAIFLLQQASEWANEEV